MAKEQSKKKLTGRWKMYAVSGGKLDRKNTSCPKCGHGTFMAKHNDRMTCGQCHYTEFARKG